MQPLCRHLCWTCLLGSAVLWLCPAHVGAQGLALWDGEGVNSEWAEPANWQNNTPPTPNDTARILNDTATITATFTGGAFTAVVNSLEVGLGTTPGGLVMDGDGGVAILHATSQASIGAQAKLAVGGSVAELRAGQLTNQGEVTVSTGGLIASLLPTSQYTQSGGTTTLLGGQLSFPTLQFNRGDLNGFGQIDGTVTAGLSGSSLRGPTISPGVGIGDLDIHGNLELRANSELSLQIDASGRLVTSDHLNVTGTATLGGTLHLDLIAGSIPDGEVLQIFTANEVTPGTYFDDIITTLPPGEGWVGVAFVPEGGQNLTNGIHVLKSSSPGDMNGDGQLDELDARLFAWAIFDGQIYHEKYFESLDRWPCENAQFDNMCPAMHEDAADMDGLNGRNFTDIQLFLDAVEQSGGSPQLAMQDITSVFQEAAIPEPATFGLAFAATAVLGISRSRRSLSSYQRMLSPRFESLR